MRTVSLAILSSFISTFLMVQKMNLSEAGRRIEFKNVIPTFNKEISREIRFSIHYDQEILKTINNTH